MTGADFIETLFGLEASSSYAEDLRSCPVLSTSASLEPAFITDAHNSAVTDIEIRMTSTPRLLSTVR